MNKLNGLLFLLLLTGCSYDSDHVELISAIEKEDINFISQYSAQKKDIHFYYHDGFTPFTYAVKGKCKKCADVLIDNGVNVNQIQKGGLSALSWAVVNNDLNMVETLLLAGANPKVKCSNKKCMDSFEFAIKDKRTKIMEKLKTR